MLLREVHQAYYHPVTQEYLMTSAYLMPLMAPRLTDGAASATVCRSLSWRLREFIPPAGSRRGEMRYSTTNSNMSKPIYPDLLKARILTANPTILPTSSTLPPQPPPSSTVLENVKAVLTKSTALSSSSSSNYTFNVEREVLARARARERTTAKENSIELDLTGVQVDSFDCTSRW